jgi:hypothetical protein
MSNISGLITIAPVEIPLLVRAAFHIALTDDSGDPVDLTGTTLLSYLLKNPDDSLAEAVLTKVPVALSPATSGRALVTYDGADVALLSAQRAYLLVVKVTDTDSSAVVHVQCFNAVPMNVSPQQNFNVAEEVTASAILSTRFVNVLDLDGITGGTGYLDGVATLTESTGVIVKFFVADEAQEWTLLVGTTASDGVTYQRPLDYAASTNEKVWKRTA